MDPMTRMNAWLADVQARLNMNTVKPTDAPTGEALSQFFAALGNPRAAGQDDIGSGMSDSPSLEARYAVDQLEKRPDGTTVVRYYFSNAAAEVNELCRNDPLLHAECAPTIDDRTRNQARETMRAIVAESGAKIEFQEVPSMKEADVSFIKSSKVIDADGKQAVGYAGRSGNKNYIVDAIEGANERLMVERAFSQFPPEQREQAKRAMLPGRLWRQIWRKCGCSEYFSTPEHEKKVLAHEIEHILGARGIWTPRKQSVMAEDSVLMGLGENKIGKVLGQLDIDWYQHHFGIKELPEGSLPNSQPMRGEMTVVKKER